ncbi:DUF2336 domain-containing protein [Maricaulis sp.]|uniref:DUF2336 domain-containing protein n=1 Tax=Maricaulis sp. TaxID=1486257 RepID=UPI002611044B|nr:DUF2336 domain-containing protein [Maricaulis sp.]
MAQIEPMDLDQPAPPRARDVLARRLADIVGLPSSRLTPRERWIVADLLHDLLRASDETLRQRVAQRLSTLNEAPHRLLRMLATDRFEVARPILEDCQALTDFDMLEIVQTGTIQHRTLVARREDVSETVAAALAAYGEPEVVERLLKNKTAILAAPTVDHLVGMALDNARFAPLLIRREELRPAQAFRLFWGCDGTDRRAILDRFAVDRTILIDASEDIFPMAQAEGWSDPLVGRILRYIDRRQRNREAIAMSPFVSLEQAMEALRREGVRRELVSEIATLSGIDDRLMTRMFDDLAGEPLAVLCKATGLKWENFQAGWAGLGRSEGPIMDQARHVYDMLSVEKAQTVLRYWNLSHEADRD